jgi:putative transposase
VDLLARHTSANHVRILGYCLMSNHVHLVAVPEHPESLARALKCAHAEYAFGWNRYQKRSGHLWQGRFFSCPLDQQHLVTALRYVDLNPVRAGLVDSPADWAWSSARGHGDAAFHDPLLAFDWTESFGTWNYAEWKQLLEPDVEACDGWDELRRSTSTGAPLGTPDFVTTLEKKQGKKLRVLKRGRPKKFLCERSRLLGSGEAVAAL